MKRLLLVALLALVPASAMAQNLGVGRCAFPNCTSSSGGTPDDNSVTSAKIVDGAIVNADVSASAAVAATKIANTPTTDSDWTAWGATLYNTLQTALDSLAVGVRALWVSSTGKWDRVVDLTNGITWTGIVPSSVYTNKCLQMQEALNAANLTAYLTGSNATNIKITVLGTATVTWANLFDYGPYRLCFGSIPTNVTSTASSLGFADTTPADGLIDGTSYPLPKLLVTGGHVELFWDNAKIIASMTGATEDYVIFQRGAGWLVGKDASGSNTFGGGYNAGWYEHGRLEWSKATAETGSWTQGRVVAMNPNTLFESTTTGVFEMTGPLQRADLSGLSTFVNGAATDYDDIGFLTFQTWGLRRGFVYASNLGNALRFYDNNVATWSNSYITGNHVGVVLGDGTYGGKITPYSSCVTTYCTATADGVTGDTVNGLWITHSTIEGNPWGEYVSFGAGVNTGVDDVHFETSATTAVSYAHAVLLGAGQCKSADGFRTCGDEVDCTTSSGAPECVKPTVGNGLGYPFTFFNSILPQDGTWAGNRSCTASTTPRACCTGVRTGTCVDWDGLFLGPQVAYNGSGRVNILGSYLGASYKPDSGTSTIRVPFGVNTYAGQRPQVFIGGGSFASDNALVFAPYKNVSTDKEIKFVFTMDKTDLSAEGGKCLSLLGGAPTACTASGSVAAADLDPDLWYTLPDPPYFYETMSCVLYDATGWASGDYIKIGLQEVGSDSVLDAALGAPIRIPHTGAAAAFTTYTKIDANTPALGVMGATNAVAVRARIDATTVDVTSNAVGRIVCTVTATPMPSNHDLRAYGKP